MPRKRDPEGKPQKFKMLPSQQMQQEAYSHASPPKGIHLLFEHYTFNSKVRKEKVFALIQTV